MKKFSIVIIVIALLCLGGGVAYTVLSSKDNSSYENKKVNYYYPSLSASSTGYWQAPSDENPWTPGEELDQYYYVYSGGQFIYAGPDNDFDGVQLGEGKINEKNYKYVVGDGYKEGTFFDPYVVASRSVGVSSGGAAFNIAGVDGGIVGGGNNYLCSSDADGRL